VRGLRRLYLAAGLGAAVTLVLLIGALGNPRGYDYPPAWFAYLSFALAFYISLGVSARMLVQSERRHKWLVTCAVISILVALVSAQVAGFILFAPPVALLLWVSIGN